MNTEKVIVISKKPYVKKNESNSEKVKSRKRKIFPEVDASDIKPELWDLGCRIAGCVQMGRSVHVPHLQAQDLGHVLRAMEITKYQS